MRKGVHTRKLNRTSNERRQLFRNLIREMSQHGYMVTTEARAKAVKPQFEKLITTAKDDSLVSFRKLVAEAGDVRTAKTLQKLGELFAKRAGGYTRLIKLGSQFGNNAKVVRMELVEKLVTAEVVTPKEKKVVGQEVASEKPVETKRSKTPVKKEVVKKQK